ncbi:hypothetical protein [Bombella apis]|uniref:Flagellar hook-length control protein FliK n=1 Tax=Bombella apis TaxID=1785988 RepID=A0ABR9MS25_9PROT|nr:hypothetical protein [Bombella apis]MBE1724186.1 hypothetical protein [Bombella apis]MBR9730526.1 hypothetical protein [Bombella apis]
MAILDTLIAQSDLIRPPTHLPLKQGTAAFRRNVMGALALFTGGRSLTGLKQQDTDGTDVPVMARPLPAMMPTPEPPVRQSDATTPEAKAPSPQPMPPSAVQTVRDWSTLLAQSTPAARQALKDVEPTLHNAEQALERVLHLQARQADETREGTDPGPLLQGFSAMMTARSILNLHAPEGLSSPHDETGRQKTPPPRQPGRLLPAMSIPYLTGTASRELNVSPTPQQDQERLHRLSLTLARTDQTLSRMLPAAPGSRSPAIPGRPTPGAGPALAHLARHVETAARPHPLTTHNTTTHSPTINITVTAGHGRPQDIARAVEASTIKALARQTLTQTG